MAAEEDNFDIDIYGDGDGGEYQEEGQVADKHQNDGEQYQGRADLLGELSPDVNQDKNSHNAEAVDNTAMDASAPQEQSESPGLKSKEGKDERPADPNATSACYLSELQWWQTDDDIRGWANEAGCEGEVKEVTFNEQKINGKSKGQAYVLLETSHGATALKHKIEEHVETGKQKFKVTVTFSNPYSNPFKTLPKDGAMRNNNNNNSSSSSSNNNNNSSNNSSNSSRQINQSGYGATTGGHTGGYDRGGYRGGRGNYNRGGYNAGSGFNSNRGGFQQQMSGGYQGGQMNNFSGMNSISSGWGGGGSFNRGGAVGVGIRGGNMGIRGGRGGMGNPGMIGMPMGGGMMPNMGMGMQPMNGGMIMQGTGGFQGGGYNPRFFPQQGGDVSWNPHGAKRTRQE